MKSEISSTGVSEESRGARTAGLWSLIVLQAAVLVWAWTGGIQVVERKSHSSYSSSYSISVEAEPCIIAWSSAALVAVLYGGYRLVRLFKAADKPSTNALLVSLLVVGTATVGSYAVWERLLSQKQDFRERVAVREWSERIREISRHCFIEGHYDKCPQSLKEIEEETNIFSRNLPASLDRPLEWQFFPPEATDNVDEYLLPPVFLASPRLANGHRLIATPSDLLLNVDEAEFARRMNLPKTVAELAPVNHKKEGEEQPPGIVFPVTQDAVRQFQTKATQGDVQAQTCLGFMYSQRKGVPEDDAMSANWYRKAAEQGSVIAQFNLARKHIDGLGVRKDEVEAIKWYRKAAEQGHASAQYLLGTAYHYGKGVKEDNAEAMKWYRKAALQGRADAQARSAGLFSSVFGQPKDKAEAVKWLQKYAAEGDADAQLILAHMYEGGWRSDYRYVAQNDSEAAKWYRLAAEQGRAEGQYQLGLLHEDADGPEAVAWFVKAAIQGHDLALTKLCVIHANGKGVPKDGAEAIKWDVLAKHNHLISSSDGGYGERGNAISGISREQVEDGKRRAEELGKRMPKKFYY